MLAVDVCQLFVHRKRPFGNGPSETAPFGNATRQIRRPSETASHGGLTWIPDPSVWILTLDLDQNEKGWRFRYLVTTPSHGSSRDRIATELMLSGASFLLFGGFMNFCLVLGFWGGGV